MATTGLSRTAGSGPRTAVRPAGRITAKRGEGALRHLADFLDVFMWQADPKTLRLTFVSDGIEGLLGLSAADVLGSPDRWIAAVDEKDRERVVECLQATAADGRDREVEFRARRADGRRLSLHHAVRLLTDDSGAAELWGLTTDVTADGRAKARYRTLRSQAEKFRRQALHDALTGLPNRILLDDRLRTALESARRAGTSCGVLLMDLDKFKEINDTRGHHAGDVVLRDVAVRFRIALRAQDTAARLGGDEFAAVLPNTDRAGAIRAALRVLRALAGCEVGASIGIAIFPEHGDQAEDLLGHADAAMYRAKDGGGGFALYADGEIRLAKTERRRPKRSLRRKLLTMLALVASVVITAGAFAPVARRAPSKEDAALRLAAAVLALDGASAQEVGDAVGVVERSIEAISWQDVGEPGVLATLDRLEVVLGNLKAEVSTPIEKRVDVLITTVHAAEVAGTLKPIVPEVVSPEAPPPADAGVSGETPAAVPSSPAP